MDTSTERPRCSTLTTPSTCQQSCTTATRSPPTRWRAGLSSTHRPSRTARCTSEPRPNSACSASPHWEHPRTSRPRPSTAVRSTWPGPRQRPPSDITLSDVREPTASVSERCSGAGCTTFAQIGTPTSTTFSDTGLTASTSYSYRVRATDAAGNLSAYSNIASATTPAQDTQPPTAPSNLTATSISSNQINLAWTASTDNVGVTGYRVERCSGAGCTTFAQIGTPTSTTFSDTGLTASTSYSYRVRATDAAGNLSAYSNTASATTPAPDTQPPTAPAESHGHVCQRQPDQSGMDCFDR